MSTIADMTGEDAPAGGPAPPSPAAVVGSAIRQARPRSVSLPAAITAALAAGMFGLLYLNLNGLRDEIGTLRGEVHDEIGRVDAKIDDLRSEVSAILLDHTDRLARIETHLEIIRQPGTQPAALPH